MSLVRIPCPFSLSDFLPFDEVFHLKTPLQVAFATWAWKYLSADAIHSFYCCPELRISFATSVPPTLSLVALASLLQAHLVDAARMRRRPDICAFICRRASACTKCRKCAVDLLHRPMLFKCESSSRFQLWDIDGGAVSFGWREATRHHSPSLLWILALPVIFLDIPFRISCPI